MEAMDLNAQQSGRKYKFSELLQMPDIRERFERVRKYFFLRESTYDISNTCNIRCDGCYYYEGEKQFAQQNKDPEAWRDLMRKEKERGVTFVVLAGAEPSLLPKLLEVCYDEQPLGCIATNGFKRIDDAIGYRLHVSSWGNDDTSAKVRGVKNLLERQIENYSGDKRATFIYTFCRENIEQAYEVTELLAKNDCTISFNMFSAPVGYNGALRHTPESLAHVRRVMVDLLDQYPETVLFSHYSTVAHTHTNGLHDLFACPYPRMNPSTAVGLGRSFRQYRTDLNWDRDAACCVPDTDCGDCRHYAAGSAVVTSKLYRHAIDPDTFRSWLDYVDTYLAVWVTGYDKQPNLCRRFIEPPQAGERE